MKLRASKMPLAMLCINSVRNPDNLLSLDTAGDAAKTGTILHQMAADLARLGKIDMEHYRPRLERLDSGWHRAQEVMPNIESMWINGLSQKMPDPEIEQYYEVELAPNLTLTGHIDLASVFRNEIVMVDWKTGRRRDDYYHQMAAYAFLRISQMPASVKDPLVKGMIIYAERLEDMERFSFNVAQLKSWKTEVLDRVQETRYSPGTHCVDCPLYTSCPAVKNVQASALATIMPDDPGSLIREMTPEKLGKAHLQIKMVKEAANRFMIALRQEVLLNGPRSTGDGYQYQIIEREERRVNTEMAINVFNQHLTPEDIYALVNLPLAKAEKMVAKNSPRGEKIVALRKFRKDMADSGAIYHARSQRLERRKIPKKLEGQDDG